MTLYKATNEETGEVIEGGARDLARNLGVITNSIYNAASDGFRVNGKWLIYREVKNVDMETKCDRIPPQLFDEWERVTAPFKKASQKGRKKGSGRIRLRTRYNVGIY
jgi:hypothetical protein